MIKSLEIVSNLDQFKRNHSLAMFLFSFSIILLMFYFVNQLDNQKPTLRKDRLLFKFFYQQNREDPDVRFER